jgi:hypothetical protein
MFYLQDERVLETHDGRRILHRRDFAIACRKLNMIPSSSRNFQAQTICEYIAEVVSGNFKIVAESRESNLCPAQPKKRRTNIHPSDGI